MKNLINLIGIVFVLLSIILHSCKKEELPTLSTTVITNITATSASSGGYITSDGGAGVTERGVCWSVNANSTTSDSKTSDGTGTGQFLSTLDGLTAGSTYHVRAYATNSVGTAYGADLSFATLGSEPECITQPATNITSSGAILNGTVNANYLSTTVTFEYGTTTTYGQTVTATQSPVTGNNITNVSSDISGLNLGTTYHYRVKAANSLGTTTGIDITFTTLGQAPTAMTQAATNVATASATLNGLVNANYASATVTFDYGTTTSYGSSETAIPSPVTGNTNTSVSANISGLNPGTIYHYRTKAVSSLGTTYGNDLTFTTLGQVPTVTTTIPSSVTITTALSGGTITSDGGAILTTRGVCWSTSENPTVALITKTTDGTGTGAFTSSITGLTANTTYHVRAYATNSIGTAYGSDVTFTTNQVVLATLTTSAPYNITRTTALSGGSISSTGSGNVSSRGVCWSTTANPTTANITTTDGSGTGSFSSSITGLAANTYYHVRAYAVNEAGTAYGNDVRFETAHTIPTVTTTVVSNITTTSASSGGNVLLQGGENVTAKGVCFNMTGNPTLLYSLPDQKTIDGTGLGSFTSIIPGLTANTTYYVRAYATNSEGTAYGNEISFKTPFPNCGTVTDVDGNIYNTVTIGTQCWMAENLKTTKYNDGTAIPNVIDNILWYRLDTPGYCWYNNDEATNKNVYGALYNWYAVSTQNLCPSGWRVPTDSEWTSLTNFLANNGYGYLGSDMIAKSLAATSGWHISDLPGSPGNDQMGNNSSGFTTLPAGNRFWDGGAFGTITQGAYFWSSTAYNSIGGWCRGIFHQDRWITRSSENNQEGKSVRCLKGN